MAKISAERKREIQSLDTKELLARRNVLEEAWQHACRAHQRADRQLKAYWSQRIHEIEEERLEEEVDRLAEKGYAQKREEVG